MRYMQVIGALVTFFHILGQADQCTLFASYTSGKEKQREIFFTTEEEFVESLTQFAQSLPQEGLCKLAYSTQNPSPFLEKKWEECMNLFEEQNLLEEDFYYFPHYTSFMGSVKLEATGWGSATGDEKAKSVEAQPFFALRLTPRDRKNIQVLLTDLSDKTYLQLFVAQTSMNRKGDRVRVVHPMRFIGYILSDPHLHRCLKTVEKDPIKFKEFLRGFEEHMLEKEPLNEFQLYAPGFAELLDVDVQDVFDILESKNYGDLIKKFI